MTTGGNQDWPTTRTEKSPLRKALGIAYFVLFFGGFTALDWWRRGPGLALLAVEVSVASLGGFALYARSRKREMRGAVKFPAYAATLAAVLFLIELGIAGTSVLSTLVMALVIGVCCSAFLAWQQRPGSRWQRKAGIR